MLVSDLLAALLQRFPAEDAEGWDHIGLSVGDPNAEITGVTCALDVTESNIAEAAEHGHNVLLTHHPLYIKAPATFAPADASRPQCSAALYTAARAGMSVISLHTNLDRSIAARTMLPRLMGLEPYSSLEHADNPSQTGLGALCDCAETHLSMLAQAAARAFDSEPRVWGDPNANIKRVAFLGGSLGDFGELAIANDADVIICGEAGYHVAQDLAIRGLSVILLGHDRSEEPFVNILTKEAASAGVDPATIDMIKGRRQWWTVHEGERS